MDSYNASNDVYPGNRSELSLSPGSNLRQSSIYIMLLL